MRKINLLGQRFGRLLVIEEEGERHKSGQVQWVCKCDCNNEVVVLGNNLRHGTTTSCGCFMRERARECMADLRKSINNRTEEQLVNHTFNRLTVINFYDFDPGQKGKTKRWLCRCSCGKEVVARTNALVTGRTKSCGCWRKESRMMDAGICARNHLLATYKAAAKRRGYMWGLSAEEFFSITQQNCHYCGSLPSERRDSKRYNGGYVCNGVDRRNNEHGYIPENALPACKDCNRMKGTMTYEQFVVYLRKVGSFQLGISATGISI